MTANECLYRMRSGTADLFYSRGRVYNQYQSFLFVGYVLLLLFLYFTFFTRTFGPGLSVVCDQRIRRVLGRFFHRHTLNQKHGYVCIFLLGSIFRCCPDLCVVGFVGEQNSSKTTRVYTIQTLQSWFTVTANSSKKSEKNKKSKK